jgi:outer membrane protein
MNAMLSLATAFAALASAGQAPMTLEEALAVAESNAFGLRVAELDVVRQRARADEARAFLGPRAELGANYVRFDRAATAQIDGQRIVIQPIDTAQAIASVSMPIDISGRLRLGVEAARAGIRASEQNLEVERNDLRRDVKRAYFQVLQTEGMVRVAQQAVQLAEGRLRNARLQFEAGVVARVDVIRAETLLAQAQTDLVAAQNADSLARNAFNMATARPIEAPVELVDVPAPTLGPLPTEALVQVARGRRPELRVLANQLDALESVRRIEEKGLSPTLAVAANYQRNLRAAGFGAQAGQATASLALNWPLFDSGLTRARVRAARQDEEQLRVLAEQGWLAVSLEVRQALVQLQNAASRRELGAHQAKLAEENFRLAQVRYDAGEGILLEILDAQTELTRARTLFVTAQYDYLSAYADLQRAVAVDDVAGLATQAGGDR